jgi:hypothetical protein
VSRRCSGRCRWWPGSVRGYGRELVDAACPVRDIAELTHGQVIEVLVANRLTSPAPLVHVQEWARAWAVGEAFGVDPELLNDDRLGRALDAIAPHLDRLAGSVGLAAIEAFGIEVTRLLRYGSAGAASRTTADTDNVLRQCARPGCGRAKHAIGR